MTVLDAKLPIELAEMLLLDTPTDALTTPPVEKEPIVAPVASDVIAPLLDCALKTAALESFAAVDRDASVTLLVATLPKADALIELPDTVADAPLRARPNVPSVRVPEVVLTW